MMNVVSSERKSERRPRKFSSSLSFPHLPPYEPLFAERVPALQAFQLAIANHLQRHVESTTRSFGDRVRRLLGLEPSVFRAVECGVFTGSSLMAFALLARDSGIDCRLIGLDTFTGLPQLSEQDLKFAPADAPYRAQTLFADTSPALVQSRLDEAGVGHSVRLVPGLFSESLPTLQEQRYQFVSIDCDLYEPHLECLEYFYPRMARGGVLFFDDYHSVHYPMAGRAIDDFLRDKPEGLMHLRFGADAPNRTKAYLVKY
jgi:O-methyltransferase